VPDRIKLSFEIFHIRERNITSMNAVISQNHKYVLITFCPSTMSKHSNHIIIMSLASLCHANCHLYTTYQFFEFTVSANFSKFSCILQASCHTAAGQTSWL